MTDSRTRVVELLREAGQAHHHAFAATNGEDPAWPAWYARYLISALPQLVGASFSPDTLAEALKAVDAEHRAKAPSQEWAGYYADWFLARGAP
jgi:hypothetical protein